MACGSMPISHQKKTFDKKFGKVPYNYSRKGELIQKIKAMRSLVKMCKDNNIKLIIAIPPNFRKITFGFKKRMEDMLNGYGIVWNYDESNPLYSNPDLFFDNAHLQKTGSIVYTAEFAHFLKQSKILH